MQLVLASKKNSLIYTKWIFLCFTHFYEFFKFFDSVKNFWPFSKSLVRIRTKVRNFWLTGSYAEFWTWSCFCPCIDFLRVSEVRYPSCLFFIQQAQFGGRKSAPRHKITLSGPVGFINFLQLSRKYSKHGMKFVQEIFIKTTRKKIINSLWPTVWL